MAEKGLISKSTLTAIADAIRAKKGTTGGMLPGEMAAIIEGLSGFNFVSGTFTGTNDNLLNSGSGWRWVGLGAVLPVSDNCLFVCYLSENGASDETASEAQCILIKTIKGETSAYTLFSRYSNSSIYKNIASDKSELGINDVGTITTLESFYTFTSGRAYEWWYVYE